VESGMFHRHTKQRRKQHVREQSPQTRQAERRLARILLNRSRVAVYLLVAWLTTTSVGVIRHFYYNYSNNLNPRGRLLCRPDVDGHSTGIYTQRRLIIFGSVYGCHCAELQFQSNANVLVWLKPGQEKQWPPWAVVQIWADRTTLMDVES